MLKINYDYARTVLIDILVSLLLTFNILHICAAAKQNSNWKVMKTFANFFEINTVLESAQR